MKPRNDNTDVERKLANWTGGARKKLIAQLREAVRPRGAQKLLFNELLRRMEQKEFATPRAAVERIEAEEAAGIMGVRWLGSADLAVYGPAHRLRGRIKEASARFEFDPGAFLTNAPYEIEVSRNPPSKKNTGPCVGLILADATDWFVGDVIEGILSACKGAYDLIVEVSNYSPQAESKIIKRLSERMDGLLIVPGGDHASRSAIKPLQDIPTVLIDRYFTNVPDLPCVHPSDRAAGKFAAFYLKEQGCKRILVVDQGARANTTFSITPLKERFEGCSEADTDLEVQLLRQAGTDEEGGYEALRDFEAEEGPIQSTDGIFALADHVAVGCHSYLRQHRKDLSVPVLSVEGQRFGDYTDPQLLSIKFGNFEMGRLAAEILIAKIEGKPDPKEATFPHTEIEPRLLRQKPGSTKREEIPLPVY